MDFPPCVWLLSALTLCTLASAYSRLSRYLEKTRALREQCFKQWRQSEELCFSLLLLLFNHLLKRENFELVKIKNGRSCKDLGPRSGFVLRA